MSPALTNDAAPAAHSVASTLNLGSTFCHIPGIPSPADDFTISAAAYRVTCYLWTAGQTFRPIWRRGPASHKLARSVYVGLGGFCDTNTVLITVGTGFYVLERIHEEMCHELGWISQHHTNLVLSLLVLVLYSFRKRTHFLIRENFFILGKSLLREWIIRKFYQYRFKKRIETKT